MQEAKSTLGAVGWADLARHLVKELARTDADLRAAWRSAQQELHGKGKPLGGGTRIELEAVQPPPIPPMAGESAPPMPPIDQPMASAGHEDMNRAIASAVRFLPAVDHELLTARFHDGMDEATSAARVSLSVRAANHRTEAACRQVRDALSRSHPDTHQLGLALIPLARLGKSPVSTRRFALRRAPSMRWTACALVVLISFAIYLVLEVADRPTSHDAGWGGSAATTDKAIFVETPFRPSTAHIEWSNPTPGSLENLGPRHWQKKTPGGARSAFLEFAASLPSHPIDTGIPLALEWHDEVFEPEVVITAKREHGKLLPAHQGARLGSAGTYLVYASGEGFAPKLTWKTVLGEKARLEVSPTTSLTVDFAGTTVTASLECPPRNQPSVMQLYELVERAFTTESPRFLFSPQLQTFSASAWKLSVRPHGQAKGDRIVWTGIPAGHLSNGENLVYAVRRIMPHVNLVPLSGDAASSGRFQTNVSSVQQRGRVIGFALNPFKHSEGHRLALTRP